MGRLDGNYFEGRRKDLNALKLRPLSIANGALATSRQREPLDLGGRDASHIRTSPDGESWSGWSRIGSEPTVELPAAEGEGDGCVQGRNGPGLASPVLSDSILIDQTPHTALIRQTTEAGIAIAEREDGATRLGHD